MNEQIKIKPMPEMLRDLLTEVASLHAKVDELKAITGNPIMPEIPEDPEVLALKNQIQDKIKNAQVSELKKTLADLQTPVEGEVVTN